MFDVVNTQLNHSSRTTHANRILKLTTNRRRGADFFKTYHGTLTRLPIVEYNHNMFWAIRPRNIKPGNLLHIRACRAIPFEHTVFTTSSHMHIPFRNEISLQLLYITQTFSINCSWYKIFILKLSHCILSTNRVIIRPILPRAQKDHLLQTRIYFKELLQNSIFSHTQIE